MLIAVIYHQTNVQNKKKEKIQRQRTEMNLVEQVSNASNYFGFF